MPNNTFKFHQLIINHVMTDYDSLKDLPKCSRKKEKKGGIATEFYNWYVVKWAAQTGVRQRMYLLSLFLPQM